MISNKKHPNQQCNIPYLLSVIICLTFAEVTASLSSKTTSFCFTTAGQNPPTDKRPSRKLLSALRRNYFSCASLTFVMKGKHSHWFCAQWRQRDNQYWSSSTRTQQCYSSMMINPIVRNNDQDSLAYFHTRCKNKTSEQTNILLTSPVNISPAPYCYTSEICLQYMYITKIQHIWSGLQKVEFNIRVKSEFT